MGRLVLGTGPRPHHGLPLIHILGAHVKALRIPETRILVAGRTLAEDRHGLPIAQRLVAQYVTVYNEQRLHSALGYITPLARLQGPQAEIHAARDRKLEQARQQREQAARSKREKTNSSSSEKVA
ncbi:MAG: integrase core domain-containing protein [Candidatus Solibacter sp.]